ncbi:MAG: RNA polymerase sporulation sigma factor SigK [Firmicutes bacterium]|nr:RNA polymerase sporulation sigma factor SigK [Bacillota bacterium]
MLFSIFNIISKIFFLALHIINPNSFPKPLSPDEEKEYFKKVVSGDKKSKEKLIKHNLRLVAHIIKKFNLSSENNEDLISVGTIGLIKAVNTFKIEKGIKFSSYASRCIENEILMYFRGARKSFLDISMADPIETTKSGSTLTLMDTLTDNHCFFDDIFNKINIEKLSDCISKNLTKREQMIINFRYGLLNKRVPLTQQEVAKIMGISRSYVSRIEKKALDILQNTLNKSFDKNKR